MLAHCDDRNCRNCATSLVDDCADSFGCCRNPFAAVLALAAFGQQGWANLVGRRAVILNSTRNLRCIRGSEGRVAHCRRGDGVPHTIYSMLALFLLNGLPGCLFL